MTVPDHEIRILARLQRTHLIVNTELPRRVDRDERQRILLAQATVFHGLCGFRVEPARQFVAVGVERRHDTGTVHQRAVIRNGVVDLELVGPPVTERGSPRTQFGDLLRDLVSLQHVLKGCDVEIEFLGEPHKGQDLVLTVGVYVYEPVSVQYLKRSVEPEIAPHRRVLPARLRKLSAVAFSRQKRVPDDLIDTHSGLGVTLRELFAPVGLLYVFAERELDRRGCTIEPQAVRVLAPAQLDDLRLPTHGVGGTVQQQRAGQSAGKFPINGDVGGIQHVGDANFHGHRTARLVHAPADRRMGVGVDEPGSDMLAGGVNHNRISRSLKIAAHSFNAVATYEQVGVLDAALRAAGPDGRSPDQERVGLGGKFRRAVSAGRILVPYQGWYIGLV